MRAADYFIIISTYRGTARRIDVETDYFGVRTSRETLRLNGPTPFDGEIPHRKVSAGGIFSNQSARATIAPRLKPCYIFIGHAKNYQYPRIHRGNSNISRRYFRDGRSSSETRFATAWKFEYFQYFRWTGPLLHVNWGSP